MAQTLETIIAINATVGNGFSEIGSTLTQLGAQVDEISEKLIGFGKDSLKSYESYEKNIAILETIWGSNGTFAAGSRELSIALETIDKTARDWASGGVFLPDDISNALVEAAHAGWDMNDMLASMPAVKDMALAANTDLSTSLDMVLKSMNALGIDSKDPAAVLAWTDEWVYAANRSAATAEEFGDTFLRMGSTMRLAADPEEILALTALMANMGTTGSAAGTLVRNSILRLLAPSQTGKAFLDQLGATDEEINSIREDSAKLAAFDELYAHGFNVFNEAGQAKPIIQIYSELGEALADIAGGYDNIIKNETTLGILSNVFGTRSATGALNIVQGLETIKQLYSDLKSGAAEGTGEYTANIMADTLWGRMMNWENKVENLKIRTGEALSEQVKSVLETVGSIADALASLDDGTFNAMVKGLEVLAAAGPGLLLAGGAFRFIGNALAIFADPTAGGIAAVTLAATGLIELMAVMDEFEKADYADKFGNLGLDNAEMMNYVQQINQDFTDAYSTINSFRQALNDSVTDYTNASATFKSSLTQNVITGAEIKEGSEEYKKLVGLGDTMMAAIREGIETNYAANMQGVTNLWGGDEDAITDPVWGQIVNALNAGYENAVAQAEALGKGLRQKLIDAITNDGKIDSGELADIQSLMDQLNRIMSEQAEVENYVNQQEILRQAQTLGLDSTLDLVSQMKEVNDANLAAAYKELDYYYKNAEIGFRHQIENGDITEEEANVALAALQEQGEKYIRSVTAGNENATFDTLDLLINSSQLSDTWDALENLGRAFGEAGGFVTQDAANRYSETMGTPHESLQAQKFLSDAIGFLGGYDQIAAYRDYFASSGDMENADRYQLLMNMYDAIGRVAHITPQVGTQGQGDYSDVTGTYDQIAALLRGAYGADTTMTPETLANYMAEQRGMGLEPDWQTYMGDELWSQFNAAAQASGTTISDMIANAVPGAQSLSEWNTQDEINRTTAEIEQMRGQIADINQNGLRQNVSGTTSYRLPDEQAEARVQQIEADITVRQNELAELYAGNALEIPVTPYVEGTDAVESLRDQGVQVQVEGDTQQLQATIDGADGQTLMEYVNGDAANLSMTIQDQNGKTLTENVTGNASSLASIISSYNGKTITVNIQGRKMFAAGGRATEASTFGEAGPEWAIPEEHSQRTAELLDAARAASGFTWPEIISRYGGMNANPNNVPATLVYSPTIYAQDADGVEDKLIEDKARMEKWYREKKMMDEMEVYA